MVWVSPAILWSRFSHGSSLLLSSAGVGSSNPPGYGQICRSGEGEVGRVKILFSRQGLCYALPPGTHPSSSEAPATDSCPSPAPGIPVPFTPLLRPQA